MTSTSTALRARIRVLGLALVAAFAFAGLAATSASALSVTPTSAPVTGASSGAASFQDQNHNPITCSKLNMSGAFDATGAAGTVQLQGQTCAIPGVGNCTGAGQPVGTFLTGLLRFQLVYLDAAHTKWGFKFLPPSGTSGTFASFTCAGIIHVAWTGTGLIGQVTSPALNVATKQYTLNFVTTAPGVQQYTTVPGDPALYQLSQSFNGGNTALLGTDVTEIGGWVTNHTFLP
jgi:hypothetical protein